MNELQSILKPDGGVFSLANKKIFSKQDFFIVLSLLSCVLAFHLFMTYHNQGTKYAEISINGQADFIKTKGEGIP